MRDWGGVGGSGALKRVSMNDDDKVMNNRAFRTLELQLGKGKFSVYQSGTSSSSCYAMASVKIWFRSDGAMMHPSAKVPMCNLDPHPTLCSAPEFIPPRSLGHDS